MTTPKKIQRILIRTIFKFDDVPIAHFETDVPLFIGPRCPWGPIYGSGSLKQSKGVTTEILIVLLRDWTTTTEDNINIPSGDHKSSTNIDLSVEFDPTACTPGD